MSAMFAGAAQHAQSTATTSSALVELWSRHQFERRKLLDELDREAASSSASAGPNSTERLALVALSTRHTMWTTLLLRHGAELEAAVQQQIGHTSAMAGAMTSATSAVDGAPADELLFALDDDDEVGLNSHGALPDSYSASLFDKGDAQDSVDNDVLLRQLLVSPAVSAVSTASSSSMATSSSATSFSASAPQSASGWTDWLPELAAAAVNSDGQTGPSSWSSDFDAGLEEMFSLGSPTFSACQSFVTSEAGPSSFSPRLAFHPANLLNAASNTAGPLDISCATVLSNKSSARSPTLAAGFVSAKSAPTTSSTKATASAGPSRPLRRTPTGGPLERSKFSCDACLLRRKKCNPHPRPDGSLPQIGDCADCVRDAMRRKLGAVECTYEIRRSNVERARRNGSLREPFHHVAL